MAAWIQDIFYWLTIGPLYYVLVFLISFSESLALIGLFVPGSTLIVFAGFLAANGKGDYPTLILVSVAGAILGDLLSYWFGARLGASFLHRPAFRRYAGLIKKSEIFFVDHGGKSVFLGRFIGFLRPFIPFIAGHARMRPLPFAVIAVISGILWGLVYPGLGFFFGTSWQLVELWVGRFSYLLAALVILLLGNHLFWKHLAPQLSRWAATSWRHIALTWDKILLSRHMRRLATRYPSLWQFLAARFSLHQGTGLYLTVGFCGVVFFAALFIQIIGPLNRLDRQIYRWLAGMQHPASDILALLLSYFGNMTVIILIGGWVCLWLLLQQRYFSTLILVVGTTAGEGLVYFLGLLFDRPRPQSYFFSLAQDMLSFPSAHAFVALVFYGLLVYMLLNRLEHLPNRFYLVISGSALTLLIGFSRLYLGLHWFSDILGGYALAAAWLTILITACEMRLRYGGESPWKRNLPIPSLPPIPHILLLTLTGLLLLWGIYSYIEQRLAIDLSSKPIYKDRQIG